MMAKKMYEYFDKKKALNKNSDSLMHTVKWLLKYRENVDAISQNKVCPLHDACYQCAACAAFLLKMVVIPLKMGEHPDTKRVCRTKWNDITYTWSRYK
ncbi:hypothetical protein CDAR_192431 [Caerostris darwini]|uniref:Uncharacterized protein n=1 Tax=Caerostris darwini TaxID=1538125 RepID=A0AAV4W056_9ARAC|nr:hypothetical protein CDAR_192431 [Caerostris darwini]